MFKRLFVLQCMSAVSSFSGFRFSCLNVCLFCNACQLFHLSAVSALHVKATASDACMLVVSARLLLFMFRHMFVLQLFRPQQFFRSGSLQFSAMAETMTKFVSFCPLGNLCSKGNSRLVTADSEQAARQAVYHHLTASSHHYMGDAEAQVQADSAELVLEEHAVDVDDGSKSGKGEKGEKGDRGGKGGKGDRRSAPYEGGWASSGWVTSSSTALAVNKGGGKAAQQAQHVQAVVALSSNQTRLEQQAIRAEQAARQAARFARQASAAFEEEANALRDIVDDIRRSV
jgi:hypothetical protein